MNERQRKIVIGAAAIVGLMLLFPPYERSNFGIGFGFLLSPPYLASVDAGQLLAQYIGVVLVSGLAWLLAR